MTNYRSDYKNAIKIILALTVLLMTSCALDAKKQSVQSIEPPTLEASGIKYQGRFSPDGNVQEFLGVPFAQAPIADLRWAAPAQLPLASKPQTIIANKFAPACLQGPHLANWYKKVINSFGGDGSTFPTPNYSEDCLYLNIWSPTSKTSNSPSSELPVLVFIHGGSNKGGWSYEPNYHGEQLAKQGLVVVSIAYRVGALGFFSHPDLDQANFGLLDQIAGLKWVQENISQVGGNPNNITVAGESSGASNIAYLMASPKAKSLFQRAIHQSGGWAMFATDNKSTDDKKGLELAMLALNSNDDNDIEKLRQLNSTDLLAKINQVFEGHFFDPVIDGHSVTQSLSDAATKGEFSDVDLMIGSNANESRMYLTEGETLANWVTNNSAKRFPEIDINKIQVNLKGEPKSLEQLDQLATSYNYTCPSMALAQKKALTDGQTWFYHFTKQRDGSLGAKMGSYHGAELPYVFNTHDEWLPTSEADKALTQAVMQYWINFAKTGNPNSVGLPKWHQYKKSGDPVQYLGVDIKSSIHPSAELCRLFVL